MTLSEKGKNFEGELLNDDNLNGSQLVMWRNKLYKTGNRYHTLVELYTFTEDDRLGKFIRTASMKHIRLAKPHVFQMTEETPESTVNFMIPLQFILTWAIQCSKKCKDGKSRNFILYFLNGKLVLKQKLPYDDDFDKGFDKRTHITNTYILNNKLYQTRKGDDERGILIDGTWGVIKEGKTRNVSYPLSKKRLEQFNIPKDFKVEAIF